MFIFFISAFSTVKLSPADMVLENLNGKLIVSIVPSTFSVKAGSFVLRYMFERTSPISFVRRVLRTLEPK